MKKALLALGLAATVSTVLTPSAQAASAETAVQPSVPAAAPAPAHRWKLMSTASDVDGDGSIDGIWIRKKSAKVCQVKVTVSESKSAKISLREKTANPCEWHGDAPLDTVKGSEISVVTRFGAHTAWHSILTYRHGKLVVEKAPRRPRFTVDGAATVSEGLTRTRNKAGQVRLVHNVVFRKNAHKWAGTREVLVYRGKWVVVSRTKIAVKPKVANRLWGWHVPFLPRWP